MMARSTGIGRGRPDRAEDIELYWANRLAAAKTAKGRAIVEFDRMRVAASKLPPGEESAVWRDIAAYLTQRRKQIAQEHGP